MIQLVALRGLAKSFSTRRNKTNVFGSVRSPGYQSHFAGERSSVSPGADANGFTANGTPGAPEAPEALASSAAAAAGETAVDKATRQEVFRKSRRGRPAE
jgi:hypothetical protein